MEAILEATSRDSFGKNEARRTRRDGRVPAVVYGASAEGLVDVRVHDLRDWATDRHRSVDDEAYAQGGEPDRGRRPEC